jgi:hypothetical protein
MFRQVLSGSAAAASLIFGSAGARAANWEQCDRATDQHMQWGEEHCKDAAMAIQLKIRAFAWRHYGGVLSTGEWRNLKNNPPAGLVDPACEGRCDADACCHPDRTGPARAASPVQSFQPAGERSLHQR